MSRRAVLWTAFAVVHVVVAGLGFLMPNLPMGDVYLVYEPWARDALAGHGIVGIDGEWVYPQLALLPMLLAQGLEWIAGYEVAWALMVTGARRARVRAADRSGPLRRTHRRRRLLARLPRAPRPHRDVPHRRESPFRSRSPDACGSSAGRSSPRRSSRSRRGSRCGPPRSSRRRSSRCAAALTIVGGRARRQRRDRVDVIAMGGAEHVFGFVAGQTERGLQLEAPVSAFYLWRAVAGIDGSFIYYDRDLLTFQVAGPAVDAVIAVMTAAPGRRRRGDRGARARSRRGAGRASPRSSRRSRWASSSRSSSSTRSARPQYLTWLIAPDRARTRHRPPALVAGRGRGARRGAAHPARLPAACTASSSSPIPVAAARPDAPEPADARCSSVWAIVRLARVPQRARHPVTDRSAH